MGKNGLGRGCESGAGRFSLEQIQGDGHRIYDSSDKILNRPVAIPMLSLSRDLHDVKELMIRFLSPLRIKYNNAFQRDISFPVLVRAALRRISSLEKYYGQREPDLDFRGLCMLAEDISTVEGNTRWCDYKRYSNRQKRNMYFGGLVGSLRVCGDVAPFMPLFRYVHHVTASWLFLAFTFVEKDLIEEGTTT